MTRIPTLAVMAGAGLLAAANAAAQTQSFSVTSTGAVSNTLSFNQFDPSLGLLTGVTFALGSSSTSQDATFSITGGEGGGGAGQTSVNFLATGPGAGGPTAITLFTGEGIADASCGTGSTCSDTDSSETDATFTTPITVSGAPDLASYEGSSTFDVDVGLNALDIGNTACSGPPDFPPTCQTTGDAAWSGNITVTFDYNPASLVPEPGTLGLFATALTGLLAFTRRRRAASR